MGTERACRGWWEPAPGRHQPWTVHQWVRAVPHRFAATITETRFAKVRSERLMITFWILLENEAPTTAVAVGVRSSFSCRWNPAPPQEFPEQLLTNIPKPSITSIGNKTLLTSAESRDFSALVDDDPGYSISPETLPRGLAVEDRYLWVEVSEDRTPSFDANVEEIKYLWSQNSDQLI